MRYQISTNQGTKDIEGAPNTCPYCHKTIITNALSGYLKDDDVNSTLQVFMLCPNLNCQSTFIGYYSYDRIYSSVWRFDGRTTQGNIKNKEFSDSIINLSALFSKIYNEALHAEQIGLNEICGVGFRKALEFLIKDYAKSKFPDDTEKIEKKMLGPCITDYVNDSRIQNVAKRAVWLGNDETHYVRRWENKDLNDLKKLIDLTIHWIEMEILTSEIESEMPEPNS